ncbi:beta-phosphoglucomutase [Weissella oryzae SG25]|uniref:Beta-phosphoglucomutase n=1 Tax=Weissella oryzae (strain DSM 25784 / JCM 18191 / LMG 30913 / SG25) TaxID=1329250 RepID=A0A069CSP8_WEIOS|nr:beta-phosphoglucomutase [Weissella oryzae]GAK30422.1 beta-phosphoglucomutase [Weissella oryzae SG25]
MITFDEIKGFAFDMDGVLADTARFHAIAWRQIADEVGTTWTEELAEALKGIDRMGSLDLILQAGDVAEQYDLPAREALANKKNDNYRALISKLTSADALPGIFPFLDELLAAGYKMSIASASKNAPFIVERLGMEKYFDAIVDPASVKAGKPDPAIFAAAAAAIDLAPEVVVGLEDSAAGIKSINDAGELSIGIGDSTVLHEAALNFASTAELSLAKIAEQLH